MHTLRHRLPIVLAVFLALALPAIAAAPAAAAPVSASSSGHTWWVAVGQQTRNGAISGMTYGPEHITIDNGDTVDFYANSLEIHTVTFTANNKPPSYPFNPANLSSFTTGTKAMYTGMGKNMSSVLLSTFNFGPAGVEGIPVATSYMVTFNLANLKKPMTIPYYCLVHPGMVGWVTVQPKGWHYPHSQAYYNSQSRAQAQRVFAEGYGAMDYQEDHYATNHRVAVGVTVDSADVMRFINSSQYINEGQSITFKNNSMGPHTVTFGAESTKCPPTAGPQCDIGTTPTATHATYKGGMFNVWLNPGQWITITFDVKDGSYHYVCALHDYMGMVGDVVVY